MEENGSNRIWFLTYHHKLVLCVVSLLYRFTDGYNVFNDLSMLRLELMV